MSPIIKSPINSKREQGFALPSAIFLLVILAMFIAALLAINNFFGRNSTLDTLDTKAYLSAKAGLEYGMYQANKASACTASQTISLSGPDLQGFKATYTCTLINGDEAGIVTTYYRITSIGCNGSAATCASTPGKPSIEDYVEKSLTATIAK